MPSSRMPVLASINNPGGLGAILTQIDEKGEHCVIAYASRKLQKHEANYTPFLLEMQAALWGMDHFDVYLTSTKTKEMIILSDCTGTTITFGSLSANALALSKCLNFWKLVRIKLSRRQSI